MDQQLADFNRIAAGIKRWKNSTEDMTTLLSEAHEKEIWKVKYKTFKDFLIEECGISKAWGYRLLKVANMYKQLGEGTLKDLGIKQIEALSAVPEGKREEVLEKARASGSVTEKSIARAADEDTNIVYDEIGRRVPTSILDDWTRAEGFSETIALISRAKTQLNNLLKEEDIITAELTNGVLAEVNHVYFQFKQVLPYSVCPTCNGLTKKKCTLCGQRGFISKYRYDNVVPEEMKKIVEKSVKR